MKLAVMAKMALLLALSGCATQNLQKHLLNAPAIGPEASPTRGVVFGTIDSKTTALGFIPDKMQVSFKNSQPNPSLKDPTTGEVKTTYQLIEGNLDLAATIPGIYYLQGLLVNTTITNYDFASWNKRMGNRYGYFALNPGEVIYIGNLKLDPEGMTIHMQVEDRFDEMKAKLPPELGNKMVKKLLLLPESITFDNQTHTLIHR
jgi:hypothetical protein